MPFVLHLIVITIGLLLFAFVPSFSPVVPKMLQMIRGFRNRPNTLLTRGSTEMCGPQTTTIGIVQPR